MIDMITDIFRSYNYTSNLIDGGIIFSAGESSSKTAYWLVVQEKDLKTIENRQSDIFELCKKSVQDPALDKNISMIVLWETGGNIEISEIKKTVMTVEEDPYFFKKHVLYYSPAEVELLINAMNGTSIFEFINDNVSSQSVFSNYRKEPLSQSWEAFLYRIVIKIPLIDIDIGLSEGLDSLFDNNMHDIEVNKDKDLISIDREFFNIVEADSTAEELLKKLLPILEGNNDGD